MKPWTCEAHVYLNPPSILEDSSLYDWETKGVNLNFFNIPSSFKHFMYHVPFHLPHNIIVLLYPNLTQIFESLAVSRPQYDILVLENNRQLEHTFTGLANSLSIYRDGWHKTSYEVTHANREILLHISKQNEIIWVCRDCKDCQNFGFISMGELTSFDHLSREITNMNILNYKKIIWGLFIFPTFANALKNIEHKNEYKLLLNFAFQKLKPEFDYFNVDVMRQIAEMGLLSSALVNLSYTRHFNLYFKSSHSFKILTCPVERNPVFFPAIHLNPAGKLDHFPFLFHPSRLKFVSCGNTSVTGLSEAFIELVSVFDIYIWIGMTLTTITVSWIAKQFVIFYYSNISTRKYYQLANISVPWLDVVKM